MSLGTNTRVSRPQPAAFSDENSSEPTDRVELERRCSQALMTIMPQVRQIISRERDATDCPLTVQQFSVLKTLQHQERLISELADTLKVSRPTMSRIIDGLEGRKRSADTSENPNRRPKLVERVASQYDHRLVYARITPEGRAILRVYNGRAEESLAALLQHLNPKDLPNLLHSLETLVMAIQTKA